MEQYISKAAVIAEIERIYNSIGSNRFLSEHEKGWNHGKEEVCEDLLHFLDTLEVKEEIEADLEKEFDDFLEKENAYVDDDDVIHYYNGSTFNHTWDIYPIAKHFFNLGLRARKGGES